MEKCGDIDTNLHTSTPIFSTPISTVVHVLERCCYVIIASIITLNFPRMSPHFLHTSSTLSAFVFCVEHASFHFTILHTSPHLSPHFSTLFLYTKLHTFLHLHTDFHTSPHPILHTKCGDCTPFTSHSVRGTVGQCYMHILL